MDHTDTCRTIKAVLAVHLEQIVPGTSVHRYNISDYGTFGHSLNQKYAPSVYKTKGIDVLLILACWHCHCGSSDVLGRLTALLLNI
jgi:hypothetical protein